MDNKSSNNLSVTFTLFCSLKFRRKIIQEYSFDLQSRNRDTDVENKCMDTETESWGGVVAGDTLEIYVYKTDS